MNSEKSPGPEPVTVSRKARSWSADAIRPSIDIAVYHTISMWSGGLRFELLDRDGLREVPRLVDVQAAQARDAVGEQLQRHDRERSLQERRRPRDVDDV